jgi:hypothetical protein
MIRQQVVELNKCRTMMAELAKRLRRIILHRPNALGEGEAERIVEDIGLKEWVEVTGGDLKNVIGEIALGQFPQELIVYEQRIVDTIREVLGQSRFQRAQRENVESAEEAARIGYGDDTPVGRNESAMEDFITDSVRKWWQGFRAITTDEVVIPIVGEEDARMLENEAQGGVLSATPAQIQGEYLFRMRLGSSRPNNEVREKAEAMQHLQVLQPWNEVVQFPQLLIKYFLAHNMSPRRMLANQQERNATGAAIPKGDGKAKPQGSQKPIDMNIVRPPGGQP